MQSLTYVEIDIDYCSLTYGVLPCEATLDSPATGTDKCCNTRKTCQDIENYSPETVTLRFAQPADYLPRDIECIPSIETVELTSAMLSLGDDLGQRATLRITFNDHPHSDAGEGFDKYYAERDYNPFQQGTMWGKFRARQPFIQGRALRLIRGEVGQALEDMDTRHYFIETMDGPDVDGSFSIVAKDILKFLGSDRVQVPLLSGGSLDADVEATDDETVITLSPAGIGDSDYPTAGFVQITEEIAAFTRLGDSMTLTGNPRGRMGTDAKAHEAEDRVQLVQVYSPQRVSDIISQLLIDFGGVDGAYIPLTEWQEECDAFLGVNYSINIAEPTGVDKILSELIKAAGLVIWWDDLAQLIRLKVLRANLTSDLVLSEENILRGSMRITEQPDKRASTVMTYFAQLNPLKGMDDPSNFRSAVATIDAEAETNFGVSAIQKIFTRCIPQFGLAIAERVNEIRLSRFREPPRKFNFDMHRDADVELGGTYAMTFWPLQDEYGAPATISAQVTKLEPHADRFALEAEEITFTAIEDEDPVVSIDTDVDSFNWRLTYDTLFPAPESGDTIYCRIEEGVVVGSVGVATPAFEVGDWPSGVILILINNGRIQGIGGRGGDGQSNGAGVAGGQGGTALYTRFAVELRVSTGAIWGGGGGGGGGGRGISGSNIGRGGGGGGGQGKAFSQGGLRGSGNNAGNNGNSGTPDQPGLGGTGGPGAGSGGAGGTAGASGNSGSNGNQGAGGAGGPTGYAIDGVSFVTVTEGPGDILGGQVN